MESEKASRERVNARVLDASAPSVMSHSDSDREAAAATASGMNIGIVRLEGCESDLRCRPRKLQIQMVASPRKSHISKPLKTQRF
jgi:hypothetical protein